MQEGLSLIREPARLRGMSLALRSALIGLPLFACPIQGQDEENFLPFLDAKAAFQKAAKEGKRVLIYQNWPD